MSNFTECGMTLKQNARFCTACGYKVQDNNSFPTAGSCSSCGQSYPEGSKFCNHCGSTVQVVPSALRVIPPATLPNRPEIKKSKPRRRF